MDSFTTATHSPSPSLTRAAVDEHSFESIAEECTRLLVFGFVPLHLLIDGSIARPMEEWDQMVREYMETRASRRKPGCPIFLSQSPPTSFPLPHLLILLRGHRLRGLLTRCLRVACPCSDFAWFHLHALTSRNSPVPRKKENSDVPSLPWRFLATIICTNDGASSPAPS